MATEIQWTDETWNPTTGCTKISPGCANCYIERTPAFRMAGRKFVHGHIPLIEHANRLYKPLDWKKPRRVFVDSLSDLFHEDVSTEFIKNVFTVMAIAHRHQFQILTKRPERAVDILTSWRADDMYDLWYGYDDGPRELHSWPLQNVWIGPSVENRAVASSRFARARELADAGWNVMVSMEPLLEVVTIPNSILSLGKRVLIIVGGESGPKPRESLIAAIRKVVIQCEAAGVNCYVKQLGANVIDRNDAGFDGIEDDHWPEEIAMRDAVEHDIDGTRDGYQGAPVRVRLIDRKGGNPDEWPRDLRVRQLPELR